MLCFKKSKWRNERKKIQDHKFDFVDIDDFYERSFVRKLRYCSVFLVLLKTILVYIADLWTAGILLIFDRWGSTVKPQIPIYISKWIFCGAILISFMILAWDIKKARPIIISRDISYTFTSLIATRFYTLRSYAHYCFFCQIQESTKLADTVAFFVFFTFKGSKRLIFAELPRQAVNAFTLFSIVQSNKSRRYWDITTYGDNIVQRLAVALMAFTLVVFVLSFSMLIIAFILYIPLLCHIRGNLKEYCCHKVDKRIAELLKHKAEQRVKKNKLQAEALAKGDFTQLKKQHVSLPPKEPTLPIVADGPPIPPYAHMGIPPAYNSPNLSSSGYPSRPGTPNYPSRPGTPNYRSGVPSRTGTPVYGQGRPVLSRRNSNSSIVSGMTNVSSYSSYSSYSAHSTSYGPGGYNPHGRSQTPPINQQKHNLYTRAVLNNSENGYRQNYTPSEKSDNDEDRYSEFGGSQSSLSDNTGTKPLLNRYNEHDLYRAPSSTRSYSPTPSVSSTTSNPRSRPNGSQGLPLRYQHDHRTPPRYNNYAQQGGGLNRN